MPGSEAVQSLDEFVDQARVQGRCSYVRRVPKELRDQIDTRAEDPRFNAWAACLRWLQANGVTGLQNHNLATHYRGGHQADA